MGLFDREFSDDSLLSSDDLWPEPQTLPSGLPPVLEFDSSVLAPPLVPWVADIAARMQVPPEFVAVPATVAAGAVIGGKVGIRPQANTDWIEHPNLWGLTIGTPGVLKSPAGRAGLNPIHILQERARREFEQQNVKYETAAIERELRAEAIKRKIRDCFKKDPDADVSEHRVEEEPAPTLKRYVANDTSYQSLGELLIENPNGILVYRDEIVSLIKGLDREENAEARGFYLSGWNGTEDYTFDRIARGKNLYIPSLMISMIGSTQPGRVREYAAMAVRGGAGDDGLIQRFQLLVWPDVGSTWVEHDVQPDAVARRQAMAVFERLDKIAAPTIGATVDPANERRPYLRFDGDALAEFQRWRAAHETRLRSHELHPAMEGHLAKYRKLVPALALIHHLCSGERGAVGVSSVLSALKWAEFLESHAARFYAAVADRSADGARQIIRHLRRGDLSNEFTAREVLRKGWCGLSEKEQVDESLELLEELHWVRLRAKPPGQKGGRPTVYYVINPKGLAR